MKTQTLGRLTVDKVVETEGGMPLAMLFPELTAGDLSRLARWHVDPDLTDDPTTSMLMLSMHSFVITLNGLRILIDSCNGNHKSRSVPSIHMLETPYLTNLAALGLRPEDIDMVLCTHLHFDHVGWNTRLLDGRWVPTFPNARYVFSKRDYDHWSVQETVPPHREAFLDSVLPIVEAGLADIIEIEQPTSAYLEIGDGIWLEPAFGHSPGCCTVHAKAGGAEAIFWGDVIHHPIQLIRPELALAFDDDPVRAVAVRQSTLERVAGTDTMCFPAHFRSTSAGHVTRHEGAYRYEFVAG